MTSTDGVRVAAVGPPDGTLPPDQVRAAITDGLAGRHVGERVLVLVPRYTAAGC